MTRPQTRVLQYKYMALDGGVWGIQFQLLLLTRIMFLDSIL